MHNLVIIAVLIVAVGFIFMNSNLEFTGFSIIEGHNETSCVSAGYTWENITNQSCTNVSICINETIEQCECVEYEYINETQGDCINWTSCTNESCSDEQNCTDVIIGGQCVGDICDSSHLNLCLTQESCEATEVGGYWYNDICNVNAQCVPDCADSDCGDDGCGGSCGSCNSDETCESGICEEDEDEDEDEDSSSSSSSSSISSSVIKSTTCVSEWNCSDWSDCVNGTKDRICEDNNNCNTEKDKPDEIQDCEIIIKETCFDGVMNQNEKGIDCGGICEQKCSIFTIIGSVVDGPIESSKEFFSENKKTISFIILGFFIFLVGGFFVLKIFFKKFKKQNKKSNKFSAEEIAKKIGDVTNV